MTTNTWGVPTTPDQREDEAERWEARAEFAESLGLDARTYRELAEWVRGERETVGPQAVDPADVRQGGER